VSEGCYRYQPVLADENQEIADWLLRLTANQRNWGFGLCFLYLRNVKGFGWNHKRVYRIYRALELNLRIKPKKRLVRPSRSRWQSLTNRITVGRWTLCMTSSAMVVRCGCLM
jgi:hypothetical protein